MVAALLKCLCSSRLAATCRFENCVSLIIVFVTERAQRGGETSLGGLAFSPRKRKSVGVLDKHTPRHLTINAVVDARSEDRGGGTGVKGWID